MPDYIAERSVLLVDPMLATGGSLCAATDALRKRGVKDISACVIVASPEGVQTVLEHDPSVRLFTCAIDEGLNEDAYIVPGLGDAAIVFSVPKARRFKANWPKSGRGSDDQARAPFMGRVLYDLGR